MRPILINLAASQVDAVVRTIEEDPKTPLIKAKVIAIGQV